MVDAIRTDEKGRFDGRYLLIRPLNTDGATADVWLSLDLNTVSSENIEKLEEIAHMSDDEIEKFGLMVAIKIYRPQNALDIEGEQRFRDEYMIVFNCHHANLIHPVNFSIYKDTPYLVLPYCKRGSSELLIGNKFNSDEIWKYIQDVASGLAYLHTQVPPIVHQDVKPANILIDDSGNYALTDFGISAQHNGMDGREYFYERNSGTLAYMAPERFLDKSDPSAKSDIWAFGATLCEILTGNVPFGEDGGKAQVDSNLPFPVIPGVSTDIQRLIHDCLATNPDNRPDASQIAEAARAHQYPVKSRKEVSRIILLSLAVLLIGGIVFYLFQRKDNEEVVQQPSLEQLYNYAYRLIDSSSADSVMKGVQLLTDLSNRQYVPAQLELAKTLGPNFIDPTDKLVVTDRRKIIMKIDTIIDAGGRAWPKDSIFLNKSLKLYERILQQNDSAFKADNARAALSLAEIHSYLIFTQNEKPDSAMVLNFWRDAIKWSILDKNQDKVELYTNFRDDFIDFYKQFTGI